jgi:CheY-like chemotaxis protein
MAQVRRSIPVPAAGPDPGLEALTAENVARRIEPRRGTILVVEDHNEVRLGVAQLLELNGFVVTDAADAEHALDSLEAHPAGFALMLLDLLLPGASGTELRARQLADPRLADIPVVVVSACEPQADAEARLRPAAWLEKPFRCDDLLNVVRRYVAPEATRTN